MKEFPMSDVPRGVREVTQGLNEAGYRAWIVGGCVRDRLMGRAPSDWDIATSATPEQVTRAFRKVLPTGIDHGTVTVLHKGEGYEVTTLRGEGAYSDGRRPDEVFFVEDIRDDLARRDFCVNALAVDVKGAIVDPFGGLEDLGARVIRAVGDPAERFAEDGLRILRGARFVATLEFELAPETEAAFRPALPVFAKVSPERVREEWIKTMKAKEPSRAFVVMKRTGILEHTCGALDGLSEEQWAMSLSIMDRSEAKGAERLAGLFRDVNAGVVESWFRDYRFSNDERKLVLHLLAMTVPEAPLAGVELRRWLAEAKTHLEPSLRYLGAVYPDIIKAFTLAAREELGRKPPLSTKELPVGGHDILTRLKDQPRRLVGDILRTLLEEAIVDPASATREALLVRIDALIAESQ
ncbi:MAG: tRNA nucleotidyltransferase (CCA-adding enzyme) [Polyangiales bacterium]|jgi:tRNA nucleotidyltransferase (CCA-adding enzyme)